MMRGVLIRRRPEMGGGEEEGDEEGAINQGL